MQKVIPMKNKAYRAIAVNQIHLERLLQQRHETLVHAGLDVDTFQVKAWREPKADVPRRCSWRVAERRVIGRLSGSDVGTEHLRS
jgi:hypothetical protein